MKVIHILNELKYSGAEIMYVDAASLFQDKGCQLAVVSTAKNVGEFAPKFQEAGYEVFHKPYPPKHNFIKRLMYLIEFSSFLKEHNFDIVHIHSNGMMFGMGFSSRLAGKKSVYTAHNVFPTRNITRPLHITIRWIAKNLFNCKFQTISDSVYNNELNVFKNETIKINNWYGSNRFYSADTEEKRKIRNNLGIDENAFAIISVGGCSPVKRHSDIIKATALIKKEIPNVIYLHLGEGESLIEEKELAKKLNVSDNILFVGNQSNVRKYLIASDLYLMTSKFEGISITTIEAMACKIPTILYNVPGLKDFNNIMQTTTLIKDDYTVLAEKIIAFYLDSNKFNKYTINAYDFVHEHYNMKKNVMKIFNLYH